MAFIQTMAVQADDAQGLADLLDGWHADQAGVAPGYQGARLLADRDQPGRYLIEVDFTSQEDARRNNDRPETQAWAQRLQEQARAQPEYHNYDVAFSTG